MSRALVNVLELISNYNDVSLPESEKERKKEKVRERERVSLLSNCQSK
jgi:hypothetical protein